MRGGGGWNAVGVWWDQEGGEVFSQEAATFCEEGWSGVVLESVMSHGSRDSCSLPFIDSMFLPRNSCSKFNTAGSFCGSAGFLGSVCALCSRSRGPVSADRV